jgi:thiamine transport system permease protein
VSRRHPNALPAWLVGVVVGPVVAVLAVFYTWPLLTLLAETVRARSIADVLADGDTWSTVWFTTWQAVASTALTIVIGLTPAYVIARYSFAGRRLLLGLLTAMFVLPTVVVGAAFRALLPASLDRGLFAVLAAHVAFNLAVVVRTVGTLWRQLPAEIEGAAATLGASPSQVARHVTLPLLRPAIVAAASIVFLFTFTSYGVVRVLGTPRQSTIEVEVWREAIDLGRLDRAAVLAVLQLIVLAVLVAWSVRAQRRWSASLTPGAAGPLPRPRGRRRVAVGAVAAATAVVVGAPLGAVAVRSVHTADGFTLRAWRTLGESEVRPGVRVPVDPLDATLTSLGAALAASLVATVVGGLAALAIALTGRAGRLIDGSLMLPLATSAVTIGFGMLITFDVAPVDWRGSAWLVPVGHALIAIPFVVRLVLGVVRSIDPDLRAAAATLGATPARAVGEIVVPRLRRPLLAGAAFAAAISLGEFGATSLLSRRGRETMPIAIEQLLGRTGGVLQAQAYAMATILVVATSLLTLAIDWSAGDARRP